MGSYGYALPNLAAQVAPIQGNPTPQMAPPPATPPPQAGAAPGTVPGMQAGPMPGGHVDGQSLVANAPAMAPAGAGPATTAYMSGLKSVVGAQPAVVANQANAVPEQDASADLESKKMFMSPLQKIAGGGGGTPAGGAAGGGGDAAGGAAAGGGGGAGGGLAGLLGGGGAGGAGAAMMMI